MKKFTRAVIYLGDYLNKKMTLPGFEPGSPDPQSDLLTVTPQGHSMSRTTTT